MCFCLVSSIFFWYSAHLLYLLLRLQFTFHCCCCSSAMRKIAPRGSLPLEVLVIVAVVAGVTVIVVIALIVVVIVVRGYQ